MHSESGDHCLGTGCSAQDLVWVSTWLLLGRIRVVSAKESYGGPYEFGGDIIPLFTSEALGIPLF